MIERFVPALRSRHLTILEVGGAFAHRFENLVAFLGLPTLVITDLDSVVPPTSPHEDQEQDEEDSDANGAACMVDTPGALSSNQTLRQWLPKLDTIDDLLAADEDAKAPLGPGGSVGLVRVAFQTLQPVSWQTETEERVGRTLEEAFALQNLEWTQSAAGKTLGLKIPKAIDLSISQLHAKLFNRVKSSSFDKTRFAIGVIATVDRPWTAPAYIVEGLEWLRAKLEVPIPITNDAVGDAAQPTVTQ